MSVYFIQAGGDEGPVKIGYTDVDPWKRIDALQIGCPLPLAFVRYEPDSTLADERYYQRCYFHIRLLGEWFKWEWPLKNYVGDSALAEYMAPPLEMARYDALERMLLSGRYSPQQVGEKFKISTATVNAHFPGWQTKTATERKAWRRAHPLPQKR